MKSAPNHFERLGLPERYAIDEELLEQSYLDQSRKLHPDFHQLSSSAEQQVSLEWTSLLNEAYSLLRHPFHRAEYLLTLRGGPSAAEHKTLSPEFLEEMLELRMEIEELRTTGDSERIDAMESQLQEREEQLLTKIAESFATLEADSSDEAKTRVQIREQLNTSKYIQGLLRDLRAD